MKARPELRESIEKQGRRNDWLAAMIGVSKAQFSHVLAGRRSLDTEAAGKLAAILGLPLFFLFELPEGNNKELEINRSAA